MALLSAARDVQPAWADAAVPPKDPPPKGAPHVATWPPEAPGFRLHFTSILGGSYNSEGVEEQVRFGAQMLLYRSKNPAFRDNFVFVGVNPRLNPTATRLGPAIEIQPASFFNLKMNLEFVDYFGSFSALQSFASPLSDFSADVREQNKDAHRNYGTTGARLSITPFVQFKVGPIALRNRFTFEYFAVDLRPGEPVFYEPAYDTLLPGKGKMLSDDLDLFYIIDLPAGGFFSHGRIAAGARYTAFKPLYDSTDFRPGEDRSKEHNEVHRVGPLVAFSLFDDGYSRFHEPTIVAYAQWYAAHPNRTGRDMPQGVPYLVLAFIFQSDIWTAESL
jgi:hypothetical protein